jgi:hypothetical protein
MDDHLRPNDGLRMKEWCPSDVGMAFNAVSEAWDGGPRTMDDLLRPSDGLRMKE